MEAAVEWPVVAKKKKPARATRKSSPRAKAKAAPDGGKPDAVLPAQIARHLASVFRLTHVKAETVIEEAQSRGLRVETLDELREIPLEKRDALATTFIKTAKIWATSSGSSLGAAGALTMAADVAALVAVNLRLAQHVCLSYGLDVAPERVDAWGIVLGALGEEVDLDALREIDEADVTGTLDRLVTATAKTFARRLVGGKGAGRAVPLVGAVFGGLSNYAYTVEVGNRAREFFRALAS